MALDFVGALTRTKEKRSDMPYLNDVFISSSSSRFKLQNVFYGFSYKKFWDWFRTRVELYGILSILVNDTIGGKVNFTKPDGTQLGRNKIIFAQNFWNDNFMKEVMKSIEFDRYLTGNGYGVIGKLSPVRVKEIANNLSQIKFKELESRKNNWMKNKNSLSDYLFMKSMVDEDITAPRSYYHLPASTTNIHTDRHKVLYYTQHVWGNEDIRFETDEVIHFVLDRLDGRVEGFSPIETMVAEMFLIQMIKENMISFFENGGHPSKVYSLPDVKTIDDPSYKRLIDLLRESKKVINSNGSLVYVGNLKVDDLGAMPKDLEYKDLAMWVVSNMAFAFGIPISRLPFLLTGSGGPSQKGNEAGTSDEGYQKRIDNQKDYLEDVYNSQLFGKLGFHFKFPRGNKQDIIRETQNRMQLLDSVDKLQTILFRHKLKPKKESIIRLIHGDFDILSEDLEEVSDEELIMKQPSTGNARQGLKNNTEVQGTQSTLDKSESRKKNATNNNTSS